MYRGESEFEEISRIQSEPANEIVSNEEENSLSVPLRISRLFLPGYGEFEISTYFYNFGDGIPAATVVALPWITQTSCYNASSVKEALINHQNLFDQYLGRGVLVFEDKKNKSFIEKEIS